MYACGGFTRFGYKLQLRWMVHRHTGNFAQKFMNIETKVIVS